MTWVLWPRNWGSLSGIPVTDLFFQLVQVVLVPFGAVDLAEAWLVRGRRMGSVCLGGRAGLVGYSFQWVAAVVG